MKQFELRLIKRDGSKMVFYETIEGDSLVEIFGKLPLIIIRLQEMIREEEMNKNDDDIPF